VTDRPNGCFVEVERNERGEAARVATVMLRNRRCPWRCVYCALWKDALDYTVPLGAIPAQIDAALHTLASEAPSVIKLYNSGSFFDRAAIPPGDHAEIAARVRGFERVIVECHPALITEAVMRFRDLIAPSRLEVAMGLEIADDGILKKLNKRMTMAMFARAANLLTGNGMDVRAFVIVKPPYVGAADAVRVTLQSTEYARDCGVSVVSLIPARFGTDEMEALAAAGEFKPPTLSNLEDALDGALQKNGGRVFADLWDLAPAGACNECFASRRHRLEQMNLRQKVVPRVVCGCAGQPI
jgi:archaeosine synthase beta-subunit